MWDFAQIKASEPYHQVVGDLTKMPGAACSSCSPDFGIKGVLDRFGQIKSKVLFTANGYLFKGKALDYYESILELNED